MIMIKKIINFFIICIMVLVICITIVLPFSIINDYKESEKICKELGYDYVNRDVCIYDKGYFKGTNTINYCKMDIEINKTKEEWCN